MKRRCRLSRIAALAAIMLAVTPLAGQPASAAATGGMQILNVDNDSPITSGTDATPFTFGLPKAAACPGDSAHEQIYVNSFVMPAATNISKVFFQGGTPQVGLPLITEQGSPYSGTDTVVDSGQIIDPLPNFNWSEYSTDRNDLPFGTYVMGLTCVNRHSYPIKWWDVTIDITASSGRPGFDWHEIGAVKSSSSGSGSLPVVIDAIAVLFAVGALGTYLWFSGQPKRDSVSTK